jgi:hypothetical protein
MAIFSVRDDWEISALSYVAGASVVVYSSLKTAFCCFTASNISSFIHWNCDLRVAQNISIYWLFFGILNSVAYSPQAVMYSHSDQNF